MEEPLFLADSADSCSTAERLLRKSLRNLQGLINSSKDEAMVEGGCSSGAPSSFSFQEFRCAIDEPRDSQDERLTPEGGFLGERREEDTSTPYLMQMDAEEEEDEDDAIPFENLTSLETSEITKGFDLYVQNQHSYNRDLNAQCSGGFVGAKNSINDNHTSFHGTVRNPKATPAAPWSLKKWLQCRSTSTSASVNGVDLKNGFEPDLYTLEGLRKELFEEAW